MSKSSRRLGTYRRAVRDRERLAVLEIGGSPERPIAVTSAAVVEIRAQAMPCHQCGGEVRVREHTAPESGLRCVRTSCTQCSAQRTLWFRLTSLDPS
jgi:hypothetical protein